MEVLAMAKGQRKNGIEKLRLQLQDVQDSIIQYENCIQTLNEKARTLTEQLNQEEFKEIMLMLEEQGLSMIDLKNMIRNSNERQSA